MNITRKCIIAAISAMLLAASSLEALAVSPLKTDINGKALDDIHDIMRETNGAKPSIPKYSALVLPTISGTKGELGWRLSSYQNDGKELSAYSNMASSFGSDIRIDTALNHAGVHPVTAQYLTANGKGRYLFLHSDTARDSQQIPSFNARMFLVEQKGTANPTFTKVGDVIKTTLERSTYGPSYLTDVKSGLRVNRNSSKEEYFVVAHAVDTEFATHRTFESGGSSSECKTDISFFRLAEDDEGKATFSATPLKIRDIVNGTGYSSVQIAVGDFTGEGITNQVAVVTSTISEVYLTVYTIRLNSSGALEATKTASETVYKAKNFYYGSINGILSYPVADVAAGDFDGDGQTELAVVYKTCETSVKADNRSVTADEVRGSAAVKIYKWTNGAFKSAETVKDWNYHSTSGYYQTKTVAWLKPVAADIDGDGKTELAVFVGIGYFSWSPGLFSGYLGHSEKKLHTQGYITFWYCNKGSIQPVLGGPDISSFHVDRNRGYFFSLFYAGEGVPDHYTADFSVKYPYFPSRFSVVAGPFMGRMGKYRTCDEVAVIIQDTAKEWSNITNADGNFFITWPKDSSYSNISYYSTNVLRNKGGCGMGLVADDFLHEGVELGEPSHVVVSDRWTPAVLIQAPPYHLDTIPLEFWNYPQAWPMNFNYESSAKTTYSRSGKTTDAKDTKFEATSTLEAFGPLKLEVASETLDSVKKGVSLAANYLTGSKTAGDKITGLLDNLTDKIKATETKLTNSSKSVGYTNTIEAGKTDSQLFYVTKTHVWRYPVKKPVPSWLIGERQNGNAKAASGDVYITLIAPDEPSVGSSKSTTTRQGANADNPLYQATHEEGNLFSYPTTLGAIPGYSTRQFSLIPRVMPISYSTNQEKHKASVATTTGKSESKSRQVTSYGQFSKVVGTVKTLRGQSSDMRPNTNTETFSKKFDSTEEIEVVYPDPSKAFDWRDVTFSSQFDLYVDESGIMTAGFAVTDLPNTAKLWGSDSPYWKKPDPALVMPDRYVFVDGKQEIGKSKQILPRTERNAMKLRGVRIYSKTQAAYANNIVYPGLSYEIQIPIYNASFLPSEGAKSLTVPMKLYYRKAGSNENGTLIGEPVAGTNNIGGWTKGTENNKALVRFNWDNVPALAQGAYELYVVIDPDNKIDEVHEAWTAKTPDGNNTGYFPFGISHGSDTSAQMIARDFVMKYKARSAKKTTKAASFFASAETDDEYDDWSEWGDWDDKTDFSEMVDGDTEFAVSLTYSSDDVRHDVWADIVMDFTDDEGDYEVSFESEMFPVIAKGDNIYFTFILNEDEIKNGRNLRLVVSDGDSSVEYLLDERLGSGTNTPDTPKNDDTEPGGNNGDVSGETPAENLVKDVITRSYVIEASSPVLWRIGDVTVKSSAYIFGAAADDLLNITMSPSDAVTVATGRITVTVSTIAGKTLEGEYSIPVQTSSDGVTWSDERTLTFDTKAGSGSETGQVTGVGSSGSGCGSVQGGLMLLALSAMMISRKR